MRLEHFPRIEIALRQWLKSYRRESRLAKAYAMPWIKDTKPDFLGIGAPRSASTWLHNRLATHPRVYLPREKELHFFDFMDKSGIDYRYSLGSPIHRRWYSLCFSSAHDMIRGEVTPAYSILPEARIREIAAYLPEIKIIYILRNPIERAWSGLRRRTWYGSGERAGESDLQHLLAMAKAPDVIVRGDYRRNIVQWERVIPPDRMHYIFYDDVKSDGRNELEKTCRFLGVDSQLLPEEPAASNPPNFSPPSKMPEEVRQQLISIYSEDRGFLEDKFDRTLEHWYAN
ncbi:sulfotransferase [Halieaceae bacterium IMCC14734]|uniref:Sulfotransferase n=1 Tax=Candidatus Litorirhabdus singularis TaxID=2518993 RepID=A0ABT3THX8_9GAMM|nr:sulfotransferase [Candidatus Litorirhabdus singularis]MCX2980987.1 sulfotransferase [Candidatus Litorirhabdus singularis]